jgi:hypothetical protein
LEHLRLQVLGGEKNWSAEKLSEWSGVEVTDWCGEVGNRVRKDAEDRNQSEVCIL